MSDSDRPAEDGAGEQPRVRTDRRWFLGSVFAASGIVAASFTGANVDALSELAVLPSRRADVSSQGLPIQTRASQAGVEDVVLRSDYRVRVTGSAVSSPLELGVDDLRAMTKHTAELPISCVQGWSVGARWTGVPVREVLAAAGAVDFVEILVTSAQKRLKPEAMFTSSRLNRGHALHPDTLLALELNGETLHINHGFPTRLIAPSNPGIMQTKWIEHLEVR